MKDFRSDQVDKKSAAVDVNDKGFGEMILYIRNI